MQATESSVGEGRVPDEFDAISSFIRQQHQSTVRRDPARDDSSMEDEILTHMRTCRNIPATITGDDGEVEGTDAPLTGFQQSETLGVTASTHHNQAVASLVNKSHSCERLDEVQQYPQSAEALQFDSGRLWKQILSNRIMK